MKKILCVLCLVYIPVMMMAQNRWRVNGEKGLIWEINNDIPHSDHIEMSGEQLSAVLRYNVTQAGEFELDRSLVWPMLRTLPNNTHASLMQRFKVDPISLLSVNGLSLKNEKVLSVALNGNLVIQSEFGTNYANVGAARAGASAPVANITRTFYPSMTNPLFCEAYEVKNVSTKVFSLMVPSLLTTAKTDAEKGLDGSYVFKTDIYGSGSYKLEPGKSVTFYLGIQAFPEKGSAVLPDFIKEEQARNSFVKVIDNALVLESPDPIINKMFRFAKIRASESIYKTKNGYMHGPGGESYYAAIWANDQAEYVNPLFPFIGYSVGNMSAINAFRHFARFMNSEYKPIPSSIIAEGTDIWNGAGDRGDAAMIAYGASRYALAGGNLNEAKELWPLIEWFLEYCKRKLNADGVVASDTDELEGRFPAGSANLSTSSLYYDALVSAIYLGRDLNVPKEKLVSYKKESLQIRKAIDQYFGAQMGAFKTYRYYEGNDLLRSWICMPLTVGILDRAAGTTDALFSSKLWSNDGLLTQEGSTTYWDRSTLYALRGVFTAGATEKAMNYLKLYSETRLLGEHVPYAIEAWPEGDQRHLSAESGLYCRIITEGLFGIRPTGLNSFQIAPSIPRNWNEVALRNIKAFGVDADIEILRTTKGNRVTVKRNGKIVITKVLPDGAAMGVKF